jgi:catechol 2,3-dioxygenase-like lactoylglutathione lyase family enzyme
MANARVKLGSVSHFSLRVRDPEESSKWWTKNFELTAIPRPNGRVLLDSDAILIVLVKGEPNPAAFGHMAFQLSDMPSLRAACETLVKNGVAVEDPGDEIGPVTPGSPNMGLWFHDIDGYRWELFVENES